MTITRKPYTLINDFIYHNVNNGVYRCGFATEQVAYDKAFDDLFAAIDQLEQRLNRQRYLLGGWITEADWRLFTTLIRFDAVYYSHFTATLNATYASCGITLISATICASYTRCGV